MIDYSDYIKKTWYSIGGGDDREEKTSISYRQLVLIVMEAAIHQNEDAIRGLQERKRDFLLDSCVRSLRTCARAYAMRDA